MFFFRLFLFCFASQVKPRKPPAHDTNFCPVLMFPRMIRMIVVNGYTIACGFLRIYCEFPRLNDLVGTSGWLVIFIILYIHLFSQLMSIQFSQFSMRHLYITVITSVDDFIFPMLFFITFAFQHAMHFSDFYLPISNWLACFLYIYLFSVSWNVILQSLPFKREGNNVILFPSWWLFIFSL